MQAGSRCALGIAAFAAWIALAVAPSAAASVSVDDLIRLKQAGVSEETILEVVQAEGVVLVLSVEDIIDLKNAGASDWLIRALMDTREQAATASSSAQGNVAEEYEYDSDWGDDDTPLYSDYSVVFADHYYDPFAYYWYPWPQSYFYYSPFWWSHSGFYYGGYWCWDWWDPWGPCTSYCDAHYGFDHHFGRSRTRDHGERRWHQLDTAVPRRAERERSIYQRAGLSTPESITSRSRAFTPASRPGTRTAERPAYRSRTESGAIRQRQGEPAPNRREAATYRDRTKTPRTTSAWTRSLQRPARTSTPSQTRQAKGASVPKAVTRSRTTSRPSAPATQPAERPRSSPPSRRR